MRCPSCGSRLIELDRSEILIDACPDCRGVWLDRGELDQILVRERKMLAGPEAEDDDFYREMGGGGREPRSEDSRSYPHGGKKKRRRGLLEDLLDF